MKKALAVLIPLCLVGFIGFWVSTIVLGTNTDVSSGSNFSLVDDSDNNWSVSKTIKNGTFTAEMNANPNLEIDLSDVNATVEAYSGKKIKVEVNNRTSSALKVNLTRGENNFSKIEIKNDSFLGLGWFHFNLFDIGSTNNKKVTIKVPVGTFDNLSINQGSGKSSFKGIHAYRNDIDIGSGEFFFEKDESFTADEFKLDLGSGKADLRGMSSKNYDIDVGSGECNVYGLTGTGDIDMGSGKSNFEFSRSPDGRLDMGSGYVNMIIPTSSNTNFDFDIGSGSVDLSLAWDKHRTFKGNDSFLLGKGTSQTSQFEINLGSGKVDIVYPGTTPNVVQSSISDNASSEATPAQ